MTLDAQSWAGQYGNACVSAAVWRVIWKVMMLNVVGPKFEDEEPSDTVLRQRRGVWHPYSELMKEN